MNQIDFAGMLLAAILGLPGQFVQMYQANPAAWNQIGLMMVGVAALGWLGSLLTRGRRRPRPR